MVLEGSKTWAIKMDYQFSSAQLTYTAFYFTFAAINHLQ